MNIVLALILRRMYAHGNSQPCQDVAPADQESWYVVFVFIDACRSVSFQPFSWKAVQDLFIFVDQPYKSLNHPQSSFHETQARLLTKTYVVLMGKVSSMQLGCESKLCGITQQFRKASFKTGQHTQ